MTIRDESSDDLEFRVTVCASDVVVSGEMPRDDASGRRVEPEGVAIYAVRRLLDGCGPDVISVDVKDPRGATHAFDVHRWQGKWVCEVGSRVALSADEFEAVEEDISPEIAHLESIARSRQLTADEVQRLQGPEATVLDELREDQLQQLANRYLDESSRMQFSIHFYDLPSLTWFDKQLFARTRLDTLQEVLGADRYAALTAGTQAEWERRFADADEWGGDYLGKPLINCWARARSITF